MLVLWYSFCKNGNLEFFRVFYYPDQHLGIMGELLTLQGEFSHFNRNPGIMGEILGFQCVISIFNFGGNKWKFYNGYCDISWNTGTPIITGIWK